MNTKKLEEIIRNNAGSFDSEEPSAEHFEKFLKKLDYKFGLLKRDRIIRIFTQVASVAAVILLIVSVILFIHPTGDSGKNLKALPDEVAEVENYFQGQIDQGLKVLNTNLKNCPVQKQNLKSSFKELNKSFEIIQRDLLENPGNEQVLNALINHYQTKLYVIEEIGKQVNKNCI